IGFALAGAGAAMRLKHIDFVGLEGRRVLVIVVATSGQVSSRAIETDMSYDSTTLYRAANYINSELSGLTLDEARSVIVDRLREERQLYDVLMQRALTLAHLGLDQVKSEDVLQVQGTSFLIQ